MSYFLKIIIPLIVQNKNLCSFPINCHITFQTCLVLSVIPLLFFLSSFVEDQKNSNGSVLMMDTCKQGNAYITH